jgi:hypothetical protein
MASKFQFKFSPESLPKLTSRGDNYPEWRSAWQIAFRYAELWPIVSGTTKRPDANDNKCCGECMWWKRVNVQGSESKV